MSYREVLSQCTVAISTSESPDMPALGLSEEHLRDAMTEIARHLLALGARLVYGGDLRAHGFSQLLFELIARHRRDADKDDYRTGVINYLAWPVHISKTAEDLAEVSNALVGSAELICLALNGSPVTPIERENMSQIEPTAAQWASGLTSMREVMRRSTQARIVLGGRVDQYKGLMPGIAQEALMSLEAGQPLFILGGFGGCSRDIAETINLLPRWAGSRSSWPSRERFDAFKAPNLNNGLTAEENITLAHTPHVDQAITLVLKGLLRISETSNHLQ